MKRLIPLALMVVGCMPTKTTDRTPAPITWTVVDTATIKIDSSALLYAVAPVDTNIVWTEPTRGTFTVNSGGLTVDDTDPDTLALGALVIDAIRINKLKVCGVGEDTKCTNALIRIYSTGAHEGFINTTDGYGVPFLADGNVIGLTDSASLSLDSYTIPANDRRLRNNDFTDLSYDLTIDMSNAGVGDYEADLTIELLLGI